MIYIVLSLLFVWLYKKLYDYKKRTIEAFRSGYSTVAPRDFRAFIARAACLVVSWVFLAMAFTLPNENRPQATAGGTQELAKRLGVDQVAFVLDVSASMGVKDSSVTTARLARAKEIITSIVEDLGGVNISLLGFAGNSLMLVPDTLDYLYFRIILDEIDYNETGMPGTNLLSMVDAVRAKYVDSPFQQSVAVILLTDGEDTGFLDLEGQTLRQAEQLVVTHLAATASPTLHWAVVGIGTTQGGVVPNVLYQGRPVTSKMRQPLLEAMAQAGMGHFYSESAYSLDQLSDNILADIATVKSVNEASPQMLPGMNQAVSKEGWVLIISAFLLLLAALLLPQRAKRRAT